MYVLLRRLAIGSALMMLGGVIVLALLYRAATAPVPEYEALLEQTRQQQTSGDINQKRQELESQLTVLYSDAQAEEQWQTLVTAEQINSWLATRLEQELPQLADQGIIQPRIQFTEGVVSLATQLDRQGLHTVVSLEVAPFVAEDGSVALQLNKARIGSAPLPFGYLAEQLSQAIDQQRLPGRWAKRDGKPVLLVDFQQSASTADQVRTLEIIEVRNGEIFVAGTTRDRVARVAKRSQ